MPATLTCQVFDLHCTMSPISRSLLAQFGSLSPLPHQNEHTHSYISTFYMHTHPSHTVLTLHLDLITRFLQPGSKPEIPPGGPVHELPPSGQCGISTITNTLYDRVMVCSRHHVLNDGPNRRKCPIMK